jgi:hypothetical protein
VLPHAGRWIMTSIAASLCNPECNAERERVVLIPVASRADNGFVVSRASRSAASDPPHTIPRTRVGQLRRRSVGATSSPFSELRRRNFTAALHKAQAPRTRCATLALERAVCLTSAQGPMREDPGW